MDTTKEVYPIKTDQLTIYSKYLMIKKPLLEAALSLIHDKKISISPKLMDVFSILLYYNNKFSNVDPDRRKALLFSHQIKKEICDVLNITSGQLNTYISNLRKYRLIINNSINDKFAIYPNGGFELTFKFYFKEHEK